MPLRSRKAGVLTVQGSLLQSGHAGQDKRSDEICRTYDALQTPDSGAQTHGKKNPAQSINKR